MRTQDRLDRMLDEALEMTFPASDPFTVYMPEKESAGVSDRDAVGRCLSVHRCVHDRRACLRGVHPSLAQPDRRLFRH